LSRRLELFFNVRNLFDEPVATFKEGDVLPDYVRWNGGTEFGASFNIGVKGTF
jgi:hypothetical protein